MVKEAKAGQSKKKMSAKEREELLIENFVGLQKAMIHLSMKFENLSDNMSKLLNIFELSAKDYLINKGRMSPEVDKDLLNKINSLLEQNKTIAKGLVMVEERVRNKLPDQAISQPMTNNQQFTGQGYQFKPKSLPEI